MHCSPLRRMNSLSIIQRDLDHQMHAFNALINNLPPNQEQTLKDLERIQKVIEIALGFIYGLIDKNDAAVETTDAFGTGKTLGSLTANAITKISEIGGAGGSAFGCLTNNQPVFWIGVGVIGVCVLADFGITSYLAYAANKNYSEAPMIRQTKKIEELHLQAKTMQACVDKFTKCQCGSLDASLYIRESSKCLKKYRSLPIENYSSDVYHRMISLFIEKLPADHRVFTELKSLQKTAPPVNSQVIPINTFEKEIGDEDQSEYKLEFSHDESESPLSLYGNYQENLRKFNQIVRETFGLNPKNPLRFVEIPHNSQRIRYINQGFIIIP